MVLHRFDELTALVDALCQDKALGKRVDRPCDRLREGMAKVAGGELSRTELAASILEVVGEDKQTPITRMIIRKITHKRPMFVPGEAHLDLFLFF